MKMKWKIAPLVVALVGATLMTGTPSAAQESSEPSVDHSIVKTEGGPVRGVVTPTTIKFLGIPYAAPPVGDLRWKPPQPAASWTGIRDASQPGKHCPQAASLDDPDASEDCLFLNVYTPNPRACDTPRSGEHCDHRRNKDLPVMVWIHGGGNHSGASEQLEPTPIVETGNVVGVTINYRLGPLGFLAHPELDSEGHQSANYGFMDQQLALQWVRRNIRKFGGDPDNVTIFGFSAGGQNVTDHLLSPASAGLFHRAIIQSGAQSLQTPPLADSQELGEAFATRLGCSDQSAECLRSKSLEEVQSHFDLDLWHPHTVDGVVLPESQLDALTAGRIHDVPVIQGANAFEGRAFFASTTIDEDEYRELITTLAQNNGKDPDVALSTYSLDEYGTPWEAYTAAYGDVRFACSARRSNTLLSDWVPTYAYEFAAPDGRELGATHGTDVHYLLNNLVKPWVNDIPPESQPLLKIMQKYWTNFARSGDPNGEGVPDWPRATDGDKVQIMVAPEPVFDVAEEYGDRHKCAFWD